MKNPVRTGHRPLIALAILVLLVSFAGATAASAASPGSDRGDRYHDGRGYRDRDWDRHGDHRHHGKYGKHKRHDGHDHYRDRGRYDRGYYDRGYYDRRPSRFVVPHHLYRRNYGSYERYYRGTAYYAPHRHSHRIYMFPVIVDGYYTDYRPYAYCGEAYYPDHYRRGSRGHLGLHFEF
jgi:hypothetical protein